MISAEGAIAPINRMRAEGPTPADSRRLVDNVLPESAASYRSGRNLQAVVQRPVGECFRKMRAADRLGAVEVGDGARDLEHAVISAGRKVHRLGGVPQQL